MINKTETNLMTQSANTHCQAISSKNEIEDLIQKYTKHLTEKLNKNEVSVSKIKNHDLKK